MTPDEMTNWDLRDPSDFQWPASRRRLRYRPPARWAWWRIWCVAFWILFAVLFVLALRHALGHPS